MGSGRHLVVMMETRENWNGPDGGTSAGLLGRDRNRNSLIDPLMRTARVEVVKAVLVQHMCEVAPPENDDVIETLSSYAPKEAFASCIHEGRLDCGSRNLDACSLCDAVEFSTKLAVAISNDHIGTLTEWRDIAKLLGRPLLGRCSRNSNADNFARLDIDDEESEQRPKPNVIDLQEITGPNRMVREKRLPALPMW